MNSMTHNDFVAECVKRMIDPELALEDSEIRQALRDRDVAKVLALLDSNF